MQNEVALSYHRLRGLYLLAVIFAVTIISPLPMVYIISAVNLSLFSASFFSQTIILEDAKKVGLFRVYVLLFNVYKHNFVLALWEQSRKS